MSTKIHATVDALGNPTGFHLTGGQEHDLAGADALLPELEAETLIADKAFDANARVLEPLAEASKTELEHHVLERCSAPNTCADARGL